MSIDTKKREAFASLSTLFRPKSSLSQSSIRPPYAKEDANFEAICLVCIETPCVRACVEEIIVLDETKLPSLVFTKSGCTFCQECALACPSAVLSQDESATIKAEFAINTQTCMAWNSVICNSCLDVCHVRAITFFGLLRPLLDKEICTSCGFCYGVCPTHAIVYYPYTKGA